MALRVIQNWLELFLHDITTVGKPVFALVESRHIGDGFGHCGNDWETWAIRYMPGSQSASFFEVGLWTEEGSESATLAEDELWEKTRIKSCEIFHNLEDLLDATSDFNCAGIIRDWI